MEITVAPGKYIVAVSGGVDSVVLLDLLAKLPGLELVVAHFDHGIRSDSSEDRRFVEKLAKNYNLQFIFAEGKLSAKASEAAAREARYEFLEKARLNTGAAAIITAHHQDDVLETAVINLIRGTGRRGLSSLKETEKVKRPLLGYSKKAIKAYAKSHGLKWREDPTNTDTKYLRNYVRHELLPKLGTDGRARLLAIITKASEQNREIDQLLNSTVAADNGIDRAWFAALPHNVSLEIMAAWLRAHDIINYDRKTLERLVVAAKTGHAGSRYDIGKSHWIKLSRAELALSSKER
ncbi:MAG: tRNA lysidine(34) synthetase TilS [Candidatus Saccharimonadales bacterium]